MHEITFKFNIISAFAMDPTMTAKTANLNMYKCKNFYVKFYKFGVEQSKSSLDLYLTNQNKIIYAIPSTSSVKVVL